MGVNQYRIGFVGTLGMLGSLVFTGCGHDARCGDGISQRGEVCLIDRGARSAGLDPCDISVADFDNDGFDDVVVPNSLRPNSESPYESTFLSGDESSGMRSRIGYQVGELFPTRITHGDYDGDGFVDAVAAGDADWQANGLFLLRGGADGLAVGEPFGTFKTVLALDSADLDDDKMSEVAVISELALEIYSDPREGDSPATGVQLAMGSAVALCPGPAGMRVHVGTRNGEVHTFEASADLALTKTGMVDLGAGVVMALECANLRDEGAQDLLASTHWDDNPYDEVPPDVGEIVIVESTAEGMSPARTFELGTAATDVAAGDFNDDGIDDFAITLAYEDGVSLYLSDAEWEHSLYQTWHTGEQPVSVAIGDLNGDGEADMAVANQLDDTVELITSNP